MANSTEPHLIEGSQGVDDRGAVSFVNEFSFPGVKRFYVVENFSTEVIRAFHGHRKEEKYVFAVAGSALVAVVRMDDVRSPNKANVVHRYVLSDRHPVILHVPPGFANGFRMLEPSTKLLFFSTATIEETREDDFRFPYDYWGAAVWDVEHR